MKYKYSICHIDKPDIEFKEEILDKIHVLEIIRNYPWSKELKREKELPQKDWYYAPSLDFKNIEDNYSFCLTADGTPDEVSFSVWYNRPVKRKVLFGLFGEKDKMEVIDKWFTKEKALELLDMFLNQEYAKIEKEMNKSDT